MNLALQRSELRDLAERVLAGERLSETDGLRLLESTDLHALGAMANTMRQRKVGNRASYIINRYVNYSNYCILSCQFCAFARKKRDADGFQHDRRGNRGEGARRRWLIGITEMHIVGGLHPSLPFTHYTDMLQSPEAARRAAPAEVLHRDRDSSPRLAGGSP
jgi:aminodeoxyfutalosine synthase